MASFHNFESESPDEPPPPAYEFSQLEFDQKISHALEQSRAAVDDEGEWEVWDEAAFAAAASHLTVSDHTEGASSSRSPPPPPPPAASSSTDNAERTNSAVQPLRVVKKSRQPSLRKEKERPNWYAEAGLKEESTSAPVGSAQPAPVRQVVPNPTSSNHAPLPAFPEREATPPPMFEPVGPSLDGPPYDGYGNRTAPQRPGLVMAYVPGDSRPASPLYSPTSPSPSQAFLPPTLVQPVPERRSLPPPPLLGPPSMSPEPRIQHQSAPPPPRPPVQRPSPRPITTAYQDNLKSKSYLPPRITFDPRVAYGGTERSAYYNNVSEEMPPKDIDPASFYTASVSSIYSANAKRLNTAPSTTSSYYMQSSYTQSAYSQSQPPALPQNLAARYPDRQVMRSPAPSVHSVSSQSSQNYRQSYGGNVGYQPQQSQPAPSRVSTYQPTAYQSTTYQSTAYQPTPYQPQQSQQQPAQQPATFQQPSSNSYQASGYRPTAY